MNHRTSPHPVLLAAALAAAAAPGAAARESGAAFLKLPVEARALGLGPGAPALSEGAWSMAANPAGLAAARSKEASFLYGPHLGGTSLGYAAYVHPTRLGTLGAGLLAFRSGGLEGRDEQGSPTGSFSAEDRAFILSLGRALGEPAEGGAPRLGAALKVLQSRIASYAAHGYALDLGAQAPVPGTGLRAGLAVQNLGSGLALLSRRDPLPLALSGGLTARLGGALSVTGGMRRLVNESRTEWGLGAEAELGSSVEGGWGLVLRAGCALPGGPRASGSAPALPAAGLGLRLGAVALDYAFAPMGELGSMQRVGVTVRFGARVDDELPPPRAARGRHRRGSGDYVEYWWRSPAP